MLLLSIIGFFITIAILVTFHEYGHFYFARLFGIHVKRFSVGFGKPIKVWTSKKHVTELGATEYAIAMIPLGGFVQMAERPPEDQDPNTAEAWITGTKPMTESIPEGLAFQDQPAWQRAMVVAAGPLANFLLAILLFSSIYMIGNPSTKPVLGGEHQGFVVSAVNDQPVSHMKDFLLTLVTQQDDVTLTGGYGDQDTSEKIKLSLLVPKSADPFLKYGIRPWQLEYSSAIGSISPDSPAEKAALAVGDEILSIADQKIDVWSDIINVMSNRTAQTITITVRRDGKILPYSLSPKMITENGVTRYIIGIQQDFSRPLNADEAKQYEFLQHYGPLKALSAGFSDTWHYTATTYTVLKQMVFGQQSIKNLGGPITIANAAGNTLRTGFKEFIIFLGIVSLSLGFLNILPIPVLDGGHLALIAIESIIGRPVSAESLKWYYRAGLLLVGLITIIALTNDTLRLFSG